MRIILFIFLAFILVSSSFPQTITEPLQLTRNVLVNSAGLPEEYLLFVPDTATQIFFNPARAALYKGSFVYVNYLSDYSTLLTGSDVNLEMGVSQTSVSPGIVLVKGMDFNSPAVYEEKYNSTKTPSISVGSLIDCGETRWLFTLSNGLYSRDSKNNYNTINNSASLSNTNIESEVNSTTSQTDASATALKISYITGNERNNYSVGVWGVFYKNDTQSGSRDRGESKSTYIYTTNRQISSYLSILNQWRHAVDKKYAAGAEFTINNTSLDFIGSVSYQYNKLPQDIDYNYRYIRADSNIISEPPSTSYSINDRIVTYTGSSSGNTDGFTLYSYFSHIVNLVTPADFFFASVYAYYTGGDKAYAGNYYSSSFIYSSSSPDINTSYTVLEEPGKLKAKNKGVFASAGYAIRLKLTDIQLLSGLKISGKLVDVNDFTSKLGTNTYASFMEFDYKNRSAAIVLPLYINYSPEEWVSLYGGLTYSYYYVNEKNNISENRLRYSYSDYYLISTTMSSYENIGWQSTKSVYAGFELRHNSGIRIQTYFNSDFANINNWNVSIGYHF